MGRFQYYTIYRCRNCGKRIRVHGKLTSLLLLPPEIHICCQHPRLKRERHILISKYKAEMTEEQEMEKDTTQQKSLVDFSQR